MKDEEWKRVMRKVSDNTLTAVNNGIVGPVDLSEAQQFFRMKKLSSIYFSTLRSVLGEMREWQ